MNPGLYALASLDGAPLGEDDLAVLGLASGRNVTGFSVRAVDGDSSAISFVELADGLGCFLGHLDEAEALIAILRLESGVSAAAIACAAVERYGIEAPRHILGEWTFLRWRTLRSELTVVSSETRRDALFFALKGGRLALSAEMLRLSRLCWVGQEIDPSGLALEISRAGLRHIERQETACKGIRRAFPGSTEIFGEGRRTTQYVSLRPEPEIWRGSFDDAVDALNEMGRRIVGQMMGRYGRSAFLLSGGLDSSLLASWGAQQHGAGQEMFCVSSVAPEGSGLLDEREFSSAVATRLGLSIEFVAPLGAPRPYCPDVATFSIAQSPMVNVRHYLVRALLEVAQAKGARAVMDGVYGELSVTDKTPLPADAARKRCLLAGRQWLADWQATRGWPDEAFHARFSRGLLGQLPGDWEEVWRVGPPRGKQPGPGEPAGISPALAKNAPGATATANGLRHLAPYRDRRLIELAARMPKGFTHQNGMTRSLARTMLIGRVPESIRLRQRGRPFSPDYEARMRTGANAARERIGMFREAGLEEWLDLRWLSERLAALAGGQDANTGQLFRVQFTAMTAEFLLWLKAGVTQPE